MVASLLRIVHSGPQNERLQQQQQQQQQQPNTKFFKKLFIKAGRFTTQWERLDFNTPPQFGQQAIIVLPRKGHLLSRLYLVTNYPTINNFSTETVLTSNIFLSSNTIFSTKTFSNTVFITSNLQIDTDTSPVTTISLPSDLYPASNTSNDITWRFSGSFNSNGTPNSPVLSWSIKNNCNDILYNSNTAAYTNLFTTDPFSLDLSTQSNSQFKYYIDNAATPKGSISNVYFNLSFNYIASNIIITSNSIIHTSNRTFYPSWTNSIGHAIIERTELQIGGARIERLDGQLLEVLDEFNTPLEKVPVVNRIIGRSDGAYGPFSTITSNLVVTSNLDGNFINIYTSNYITTTKYTYANPLSNSLTTTTPLPFFFNRGDPAAALPVDAIQADEIRVQMNLRPLNALITNYPDSQDFYNTLTSNLISCGPSNASGTTEGSANFPLASLGAGGQGGQGAQDRQLGDTYLLAEYIYLDAPEANRFRLADISLPIIQHYPLQPLDTQGLPQAQIQIDTPNPVRDIFFYCQPWLAPAYNAHFLATKYIGASADASQPWWPDASGLNPTKEGRLKPAFWPDINDSEPITSIALQYEGRLTKFSTENTALFRHILPSLEQKKAPWVNRYYYNIPFGVQHGLTPSTRPTGEVNYDKITRRELQLTFSKNSADGTSPRLWVRPYVETYNVLRIYGGRAGTLFGY
jgi:hypothetical protein